MRSNDATSASVSSSSPPIPTLSLLFNLCAFRHDRAKLSDNGSLTPFAQGHLDRGWTDRWEDRGPESGAKSQRRCPIDDRVQLVTVNSLSILGRREAELEEGRRNSPNSKSELDRGFSVLGAFKLDHLHPFKPFLFWEFSIFSFSYWEANS